LIEAKEGGVARLESGREGSNDGEGGVNGMETTEKNGGMCGIAGVLGGMFWNGRAPVERNIVVERK
jgi:hypothetical protein